MTQQGGWGQRVLRILIGLILMAAFVVVATYLVTQRAGRWGVPYFTFTSERGSACTNSFTGFTCEPLTLADVEFYTELDLPDDTTVSNGSYRSTSDYQLEATLEAPAASAGPVLGALRRSYGPCGKNQPVPPRAQGLTQVCVIANSAEVADLGEPDSRVYTVVTGLHPDGSRTVFLSVRSR